MFHVKRGKRGGTRPASRAAPFCSSAPQRKQRGRRGPPRCVVSLCVGTHLCRPFRQGFEIGVAAFEKPTDQSARKRLSGMFHVKRTLFAAARLAVRPPRRATANVRSSPSRIAMRQASQPVSAFDDAQTLSYVQTRCIAPPGSLRDRLQTISIRPTGGRVGKHTTHRLPAAAAEGTVGRRHQTRLVRGTELRTASKTGSRSRNEKDHAHLPHSINGSSPPATLQPVSFDLQRVRCRQAA